MRVGNTDNLLAINQVATIVGIAPGTVAVSLEGLAPNCEVQGGNPLSVSVTVGNTTPAAFHVTCTSETRIHVSATTDGEWIDYDGYRVLVDGVDKGALPVNGTVQLTGVEAGTHAITLSSVDSNCLVTGDNPVTLDFAAGIDIPVGFDVLCASSRELGGIAVKVWGPRRPNHRRSVAPGVRPGRTARSDDIQLHL